MIDFIKDADCTKDTPVRLGVPDAPIYGKGIKLKPRVDGRTDSEHFKKIYLPELLPLEEYDLIVVLISGGKDSVACYLKLLELGVPKERIEFWHHDIDGGHPSRRMDWKCTQNYVKALADVLYDDFGKLTLKSLSSMYVGVPGAYLMIDEETGQNFDYTSSIDENTYNKIKLTYDNKDTGKRDVYITQDSSNINKWGILQYFDTLQKGENGQASIT